ncbi:MAG TPA: DNA replication/repair protein RecF [Candidatus Aquicultor sp.]|jgi:DNA replication and repair protein RecF
MRIKEIQLRNYRNYSEFASELEPGLNFVVGQNAAGKTNLLESIYVLENGRSYRTTTNQDLVKWGEEFAHVKAAVSRSDREVAAETTIFKTGTKQVKVNGVSYRQGKGVQRPLLTVLFTPDHLKIVKEMPEYRRAYLDEVLEKIKPDYGYWRGHYGKILKQRNMLLKKIAAGRMKQDVLDYWDQQLIPAGIKLIAARRALISTLEEHAAEAYKNIADGDMVFSLTYENQLLTDHNTLDEITERFKSSLEERRKHEIERGITLVGPHRDDVGMYANTVDLRSFGSQGEQRSTALALKIAEMLIVHERAGEEPVLLLDDVLSELDQSRRRALLKQINDGVQVIITSTNAEYITEIDIGQAHIMRIK